MIDRFDGEYAFLSNFYPSKITDVNDITYPTVEHYFQAMKTLRIEEREKIAAAPTPGQAKHMGRKVALRSDWEQIKIRVMGIALRQKFSHYPELKAKLLATGEEELIEGNFWHDNTWGNCYCERCQNIKGKNELGKLLMTIRKELKENG